MRKRRDVSQSLEVYLDLLTVHKMYLPDAGSYQYWVPGQTLLLSHCDRIDPFLEAIRP